MGAASLTSRAATKGLALRALAEETLVYAVALDDPPAHGLDPTIHGLVRLEDPARLAAILPLAGGLAVVLGVHCGGDAGVLVLGLHAQESHADAVDPWLVPEELEPAERQDAPVHALQDLVHVRDGERDPDGLPVRGVGAHHPVLVEDRLHLLCRVLHLLARDRDEAPVRRPGDVVDLDEAVELGLEVLLAEVTDLDPVLRLELLGELPDDRQHLVALLHLEVPHEQVVCLLHPGRTLHERLVVTGVVRVLDERRQLEALDHDPRLVVEGEVHRADHAIAVPLAEPAIGGVEERVGDLGVVLGLEEPEHPPPVLVEVVEGVVDLRRDPADHLAVPPGEEVLRLPVFEEGVRRAIQEALPLVDERGHPEALVTIDAPWQADEPLELPARADWTHFEGHAGYLLLMARTVTDLFEKARTHERVELLRAAREQDVMPYFR